MQIGRTRCTPPLVTVFAQALHRPLLLDGGLATALEDHGHDLSDPLWSARVLLDDPDAVVAAHQRFVAAGAEILTTATYQASMPGLAARGLDISQSLAVLRRATALARRVAQAAPHRVFVAASAGPYGAWLADGSEYRGDYSVEQDALVEFHRQRLAGFVGADVVAFETVPCAREVAAIVEACDALPPGLGAWVSLSCRDDAHTADGAPIEHSVRAATRSPRVLAVGVNCGAPEDVSGLLRRIAATTERPLVAYPNAGRRYRGGAWHGDPITPARFAELTRTWVDAGARVVGGCCQIGCTHLSACRTQRDDAPWPTLGANDG